MRSVLRPIGDATRERLREQANSFCFALMFKRDDKSLVDFVTDQFMMIIESDRRSQEEIAMPDFEYALHSHSAPFDPTEDT